MRKILCAIITVIGIVVLEVLNAKQRRVLPKKMFDIE